MNIWNAYMFMVHYNYQYQQCHFIGLCLCTSSRLQKFRILTQKVCCKVTNYWYIPDKSYFLWKRGVDYGAFDCWTLVEEIWTYMYGNCVLMLVICAWQRPSIIWCICLFNYKGSCISSTKCLKCKYNLKV
jgi:hypothetical protein